MLESEKSLNDLKTKEVELKAQLAELAEERAEVQTRYVRDKVQIAVTLSDKLFRELYQGKIADMFSSLAGMVKEIAATDAKAEGRLNSDGYGLDGGNAQAFFAAFVYPAIVNGRGLSDILEKTRRHGDNCYLKSNFNAGC